MWELKEIRDRTLMERRRRRLCNMERKTFNVIFKGEVGGTWISMSEQREDVIFLLGF